MTNERLTVALAAHLMGWTIGPDRFLTSKRSWIPRWRFQPAEKLEDCFRLMEAAAPDEYNITRDTEGNIEVRVRVAGTTGEARGKSVPDVITHAIAIAVGFEVKS